MHFVFMLLKIGGLSYLYVEIAPCPKIGRPVSPGNTDDMAWPANRSGRNKK